MAEVNLLQMDATRWCGWGIEVCMSSRERGDARDWEHYEL